eukprot:1503119-Pyramimonas_sp.AAC.1
MALRTTYPNGLADFGQQSRAFGAHVAKEEVDESDDVSDITALLAGFDMSEETEDGDILDESEAIEILVSWRDQRNKITKEQLARGF